MEDNGFERERRASGIPAHPARAAAAVSVGSGAAAGAAIGFFAGGGPIGALVGALLGATAGGAIGEYVRRRSKRERVQEESFDRETGVIGGDLGAAPPGPSAARG